MHEMAKRGLACVVGAHQLAGWLLVLALSADILLRLRASELHAAVHVARLLQLAQLADLLLEGASLERALQSVPRLLGLFCFANESVILDVLLLVVLAAANIAHYLFALFSPLHPLQRIKRGLYFVLRPAEFVLHALIAQVVVGPLFFALRPMLVIAGRLQQIGGLFAFVYCYARLLRARKIDAHTPDVQIPAI